MNYPEIWFRGLDEKEKREFHAVLSLSPVFKRLSEIIAGFERELAVNRNDYENPAWAYKQAHYNGELAAYQKIQNLLRPKDK